MIFDTHCHYDDPDFDEDRETLLGSLPEAGVMRFVNVCAELSSVDAVIAITEAHEEAYGALGVHPSEIGSLKEADMEELREKIRKHPKIVAVGEIGLDRYGENPEEALQEHWFRRQIALARETELPVIIHSRDAAGLTRQIIDEEHVADLGGVVHCYSYAEEDALYYASLGLYIGVGGVLTFKNAKKLKEVVRVLPLDRIVLETDCPYLAPVPYRGKRNSSRYLPFVVSALAQIKKISEEEVEQVTFENANRLFRLPALKESSGEIPERPGQDAGGSR